MHDHTAAGLKDDESQTIKIIMCLQTSTLRHHNSQEKTGQLTGPASSEPVAETQAGLLWQATP